MQEELYIISQISMTDPDTACNMAMRLLQFHPTDEKVLEAVTICTQMKDDYNSAEKYALRLLDLYPENNSAEAVLDWVEMRREAQESIDELIKALDDPEEKAEAHEELADILFDLARSNPQHLKAIEHQKEYLKLEPDDIDGWMKLAFQYFYIGRWQEMQDVCAQVKELDPTNGRSYVMEGRSLMMQGAVDQAVVKFTEALEIDPECIQAYDQLSLALKMKNDYVNAAHYLLYGLQINSDVHRLWFMLIHLIDSHASMPQKDYSKSPIAEDIIRKICETALMHTQSESEESLKLRREIYLRLYDKEKADQVGRRYIELYPYSKWASLLKPMLEDDVEYEDELEDDADEIEDVEEFKDAFGHLIPEKSASDDQLEEIDRMWELFLDHRLPAPKL